ncbi:MAG: hypothetical protein LUH18_04945 [Oscillospiraceae bacterium]|nr:hypothetical protein [Oscillospiraceae bacterium]
MYTQKGNSEEIVQARALFAFSSMRARAAEAGYMTEEEIEEEIQAARKAIASQKS